MGLMLDRSNDAGLSTLADSLVKPDVAAVSIAM